MTNVVPKSIPTTIEGVSGYEKLPLNGFGDRASGTKGDAKTSFSSDMDLIEDYN